MLLSVHQPKTPLICSLFIFTGSHRDSNNCWRPVSLWNSL